MANALQSIAAAKFVAGVAARYPKLLGLTDMACLKLNQLTADHVVRIADALDTRIPVGEELLNALVAMLKGKNMNEVGDLIQRPETFEEIVTFIRGGWAAALELQEARALESQNVSEVVSDVETVEVETNDVDNFVFSFEK